MKRPRHLAKALGGALVWALFGAGTWACSSAPVKPPAWFAQPKPSDTQFLYFLGDANAREEAMARELAVQKALYELSIYCGASLTTDFSSVEIEKNGQLNQEVSLTVDVAGEEISIQEAATESWSVQKNSAGGYNAYVRLKWPKTQFARVQQARRAKAKRSLELYLEAERAVEAYQLRKAERLIRETRQALGPTRSSIPLSHPKLSNSGLVFDAVEALKARLDQLRPERESSMAVTVVCEIKDQPDQCASRWVGKIRERVGKAGFQIASAPVPRPTTKAILDSRAPELDTSTRASRYVLALRYNTWQSAVEYGFVYARCGARAVLFDVDLNEIRQVKEVKPEKGGHVNFPGAMTIACRKAESQVLAWMDQNLAALKD